MSRYESHQYDAIVIGAGGADSAPPSRSKSQGVKSQ